MDGLMQIRKVDAIFRLEDIMTLLRALNLACFTF